MEEIAQVVEAGEKQLKVLVPRKAACDCCAAASICQAGWKNTLTVERPPGLDVKLGDSMLIEIKKSSFWTSVVLVYLVPLVIFLAVIGIMEAITQNQAMAILGGAFSLVVYYFLVFLLDKKLARSGSFRIFVKGKV